LKLETQMLLANIAGLCQQAEREPEKAEQCVGMIARIIANSRRMQCRKCHKYIGRHDKIRKLEIGVEHKNCEWPKIGVTPDEYRAALGEASFQQMKGCLFGL